MQKLLHFSALIGVLNFLTGRSHTNIEGSHVAACQDTLYQYLKARDNGSAAQYGSLFTPDATFAVPALQIELKGKEAIVTRQQAAIKTDKTMHNLTSSEISINDEGKITALSHFILLKRSYQQPPNKQLEVFNGRYLDVLEIKNAQCLIKERVVLIDRKEQWRL
ncbi:nuclear transport factor 2 family protein [Pseudoalteromonas fenneropenaei]|uniref:Nuclear transport factor 2 family protein n=1 Tax=Pseudoalteromonas fenneropenaei TaxID=1737459 RepID=A0ABV7CGB4_9GAMM